MGHVGQKLRLVLRSEGQLLGFLLQCLPGLLHFVVLTFNFGILLCQQARLFLQFEVGVLQFLLAALQFPRQRLRLFEQVLSARVGLDRIQDNADRFDKLIQKGLVRRAELFERRELHHRLDLAFKQYRQDNDVGRLCLAEARSNMNVIIRRVGDEDALFLQRRLAHQSFAQ